MQDNPLVKYFIAPGLSLLPSKMDTPEARAMLLAIGFQESAFKYRLQIGGPARGFWQFEQSGGIRGVLHHPNTRHTIAEVCEVLRVSAQEDACYTAVAYNDMLACCFARLLLWTLPWALPGRGDLEEGWKQYLEAWRPGKPRPETWAINFSMAWGIIGG